MKPQATPDEVLEAAKWLRLNWNETEHLAAAEALIDWVTAELVCTIALASPEWLLDNWFRPGYKSAVDSLLMGRLTGLAGLQVTLLYGKRLYGPVLIDC